jgi:D-alanyl-D-alanine carboxypeptidase
MGQAIDFTCSGASVDRNGPCFIWLSQHASEYGLSNLPSESWHWSVDGR